MFQLTEEVKNLMFHFGISSWGGTRKLPFVFTEQGVAMLSGVLKSDRAISVKIQIMRVFIRMREMFIDSTELKLAIEQLRQQSDNNTKNIEFVFRILDNLVEKEPVPRKMVGFSIA